MKKKLVLFGFILSVFIISCNDTDDSSILNKNQEKFQRTNNDNEFFVYGTQDLSERGEAGPGFNFPGRVGFNNCNKPNGECLYMQTFGGGPFPKWKGILLSDTKLRLSFIEAPIIDETELINNLMNENISQEINITALAKFIIRHYNIPKRTPFDSNVNREVLNRLQSEVGNQVYVEPNDYEIKRNSEHPYGYIDLNITIE